MPMTFAIREAVLADVPVWGIERCRRPVLVGRPTQAAAGDAPSRAELMAAIREVEGEPVTDPPLLFKLTVLFGLGVVGCTIGGMALTAAQLLGLA